MKNKRIFSFIFLTTNTDFFSDFEKNFYTDKTTEEQKLMMRMGIMEQTKVQKEINLEEVKNLTDNEKYNIKEYDNLRKTLNSMNKTANKIGNFLNSGPLEFAANKILDNQDSIFGNPLNEW